MTCSSYPTKNHHFRHSDRHSKNSCRFSSRTYSILLSIINCGRGVLKFNAVVLYTEHKENILRRRYDTLPVTACKISFRGSSLNICSSTWSSSSWRSSNLIQYFKTCPRFSLCAWVITLWKCSYPNLNWSFIPPNVATAYFTAICNNEISLTTTHVCS